MAKHEASQNFLLRISALVFIYVEHVIYAALCVLLTIAALLSLLHAGQFAFASAIDLTDSSRVIEIVDRLLLTLMIVEILHTVLVSMRSGKLSCEPFLIVGLIASIRRILVITLQSSEIMTAKDWSPEKETLFRTSMIELAVLAVLVLTMVISIFLLHRARDDDEVAGQEDTGIEGPKA